MHGIKDATTRLRLLAEARKMGSQQPKSSKITIDIRPFLHHNRPKLVEPKFKEKLGSTRSFKHFHKEEPAIKQFIANLTSFDGGRRSYREAQQISTDISKYMAFANTLRCTWDVFGDVTKLKEYVQSLERAGIGSDGIITKLERFITAIKYIRREKLCSIDDEVIHRIDSWKESYKRAKLKKSLQRQLEVPEGHLSSVKIVFEEMKDHFLEFVHDTRHKNYNYNYVSTYLFMAFTYLNWQRPGAVINLTLEEAENARYTETSIILQSKEHKTAQTHGPAVMVLSGLPAEVFKTYLIWRRQQTFAVANFLVTENGQALVNYPSLVQTLLQQLHITTKLPTITAVRKLGATAVVAEGDETQTEQLAEHMSHKKDTSAFYYRARARLDSAVTIHNKITQVTGKYYDL